jgi:hypothetical protein
LSEILLGKLFNKLLRKRILAGILHQLELFLSRRIFIFGTQKTVGNIIEHCPAEQHRLLLHETNLGAEISQI